MNTLDELSFEFDLDVNEIERYFQTVQNFFIPPVPTNKVIGSFLLNKSYKSLPSPSLIATQIKTAKGFKMKPQKAARLVPIGNYVPETRPQIPDNQTRNLVKHALLTEKHIQVHKVRHCAHGIPYYELCPTCHRKKRSK